MAEKTLLRLQLPSAELPAVGKLFYQPISRQCVSTSTQIGFLVKRVLAAAIDGEALLLASTLRDLKKKHGISPTDEIFFGYDGANPLHLAVEANSPATLCVLIDHGCDVNMKDRLGNTPAHHAARLNYIECIKILGSPQALADFSMKNNDGFTPSRLAYIGGHMKAVQVMRTLQSEDETEHMAKRSLAEAARQRKMVRMKETLYGRPFTSFEGGRDFEVPARALLSDHHILKVSANVRAFASVPAVINAGMRKALAKIALNKTERDEEDEVEDEVEEEEVVEELKNETLKDKVVQRMNGYENDDGSNKSLITQFDHVDIAPPDMNIIINNQEEDDDENLISESDHDKKKEVISFDDFGDEYSERECYIPGRISQSRWIDFSKGRPPDLGYASCV